MSSSDKREYILWYGYANKAMCISYQKLNIYLHLLIRLFNWMKYLNVLRSKYLWLGFLLTMTKMTSLAYLKNKKHRNLYLHQTNNIEICLFNKYKTVWKLDLNDTSCHCYIFVFFSKPSTLNTIICWPKRTLLSCCNYI